MIVIKLSGGLGNQLFQYSIGRKISLNIKTDLFVNIDNLKNFRTPREYCLDKLNVCCKINPNTSGLKIINEKFFHYDNNLNISDNILLKGYWQSEKYFKEIKHILLNEITPKINLSNLFIKYKSKIESCESVSLHVRRGDYLTRGNLKFHGVCSLDYYNKAIQHIKERINNPVFFIFSDDINWVKGNLMINFEKYFISNYNIFDTQFDEFFLMSKCKHNIIANSTFSWWPAWINQNSNKIIIAPINWFSESNKNVNSNDLIPDNWVKL